MAENHEDVHRIYTDLNQLLQKKLLELLALIVFDDQLQRTNGRSWQASNGQANAEDDFEEELPEFTKDEL